MKTLRLAPLGDAAVYAEFGATLDLALNRSLQALAVAIRARAVPWLQDVVPALCGIALHFDPLHPQLPDAVLEACEELLRDCFKSASKFEDSGRTLEVPVCYDEEFGLDLSDVSQRTSIAIKEIIKRHIKTRHWVLMVGFSPGQPYLGGLDPRLSVPRRATPRTRMPVGAVAIANAQTAVYPYQTPGGWNVIGRTPLTVFDPARDPPSLFAPGDCVRFVAITGEEFAKLSRPPH